MQEEWSLIEQAREGDMRAFRTLVERHRKKVLWLAFDLTGDFQDAEDISQETFIKMYKALPSFRGEARLGSWLHRITVNTWINFRRGCKGRMKRLEGPLDERLDEGCVEVGNSGVPEAERKAEDHFTRKQIHRALDKLSDRERSVFVMRHFHSLKLDEIGEALQLAVGTVKTLNFRALNKMRDTLKVLSPEA